MTVKYATVNGVLVEEDRDGVVTTYVSDTNSNVIQTRNAAGILTSETTYWPFGEVRTSTGTNPSPWGFGGAFGYYRDGLNRFYIRARTLRCDLSRWMTCDPLWPEEEAFGYVSANPVSQIDPSGKQIKIKPPPWNDPPDFGAAQRKICTVISGGLANDERTDFYNRVLECVEQSGFRCKPVSRKVLLCASNLACNPGKIKQWCGPCTGTPDACVHVNCKAKPIAIEWCQSTMKGGGCNPYASGVPVSLLLLHELLHCCGYSHGGGPNTETCNSIVACCILKVGGLIPPGVKCGPR